jgi:hypothetical protein
MRTIWPMTAVKPRRARTARAPNLDPNSVPKEERQPFADVLNATDNSTGAELELNRFEKAKAGSEYAVH